MTFSLSQVFDIDLNFSKLLDLIIKFVQGLMLDPLLVGEAFKGTWNKVIENGLWLVDHVLEEVVLKIYLVKFHV